MPICSREQCTFKALGEISKRSLRPYILPQVPLVRSRYLQEYTVAVLRCTLHIAISKYKIHTSKYKYTLHTEYSWCVKIRRIYGNKPFQNRCTLPQIRLRSGENANWQRNLLKLREWTLGGKHRLRGLIMWENLCQQIHPHFHQKWHGIPNQQQMRL